MKKILSLLLCVLLIGQSAGIVFATGTEYEVSVAAAAFAYGTADGNDASLAVDGNASTKWTSLNTSALKDYLILDLGTAYGITAFDINPAADVAQNFTVYGANAIGYDSGTSTTGYKDKTALTGLQDGLTADQDNRVEATVSATKFRYIIFEQEAGETTFGFNEIVVYSEDAEAAEHVGPSKANWVQCVSGDKYSMIASNNLATDGVDNSDKGADHRITAFNMLDADPTSGIVRAVSANGVMFMASLGGNKAMTQVAFQASADDTSTQRLNVTNFMVVASTSDKPYIITDASGNPTYDVLATISGQADAYTTGGKYDTGLMVIDVPDAYRQKVYKWIGVLSLGSSVRLGCSTLQAYKQEVPLREVAKNQPAFAYSSAAGTGPALALDGDADTAWKSNAALTVVHDNFVIDLGGSKPVEEIKVQLADSESAKNFTIYGSNDLSVERTELCAVTSSSGVNANSLTSFAISGGSSYRYLVFDKAPEAAVLGFAEIEVYAKATAGMGAPVSLVSAGKKVIAAQDAAKITDNSPETLVSTNVAVGNKAYYYVDLGEPLPISHVAYQNLVGDESGGNYHRSDYATGFKIVATNEDPATATSFTTLNEKNTHVYSTACGSQNLSGWTTDFDTGLWVFSSKSAEKFRYVGIVKEEGAFHTANIRLGVATLQVYSKASDILAYLDSKNADSLISEEKGTVEANKVEYTANVLNGNNTSDVVALFGQYNKNGRLLQRGYAEGSISLPGAYNTLQLADTNVTEANAADTSWEVVLLDGQTVTSYITNLAAEPLTKLAAYSGSTGGTECSYSQMGSSIAINGKADCGVLGMLVLKKDKSLDGFSKDDIYTYVVQKAPADSTGPWNFSFSFSMPDSEAAGDYVVALFSDNADSALLNKQEIFKQVDVGALKSAFVNVTENDAFDLKTLTDNNVAFFGEALKDAVAAANQETINATFKMAAGGLADRLFDGTAHSWANTEDISATGITAAIKAALLIDATLSGTGVTDAIAQYGGAMPEVFDNADYRNNTEDFAEILSSVMTAESPTTAADMVKVYKRTIALSLIANGKAEDLVKALSTYTDELGIAHETMATSYSDLKISGKLSNDITTVKQSYAGGMDDVVKNAILELEADDRNAENEVLGNDGNDKNSTPSFVSPPRNPVSAPVVSVPPVTVAPEQGTQTPATGAFTDIANHGWAQDAINMLAEREILSGNGDGTFNPDGVLTREQAVKLLILTLDLTIDPAHNNSQADNGYADCVYGSWYYPYITYAKVNNLVNGVGKGEFGIGQQVTRQDLAVMLYRALKASGKLSEETAEFADSAVVSDYAQMAVANLGGMGLITGFPDGSFGPQETTTRAQAAVIFARFLELVEYVAEEAAE